MSTTTPRADNGIGGIVPDGRDGFATTRCEYYACPGCGRTECCTMYYPCAECWAATVGEEAAL